MSKSPVLPASGAERGRLPVLRYRGSKSDDEWSSVFPGEVARGLHEDTDYQLDADLPADARMFVDDVEVVRKGSCFEWRPSFYAGRVAVDIALACGPGMRYHLDVSPSASKSGQVQFDAMVAAIRTFDPLLLSGASAASGKFGHAGQIGRYRADILLARLRAHGAVFLAAVEAIVAAPHRTLAVELQRLPLSRIRRLQPAAMRDRRLAAFAANQTMIDDTIDTLLISSHTPAPTFDTPANRTLLALLRRFTATLTALQEKIRCCELGAPHEEQTLRMPRRLDELVQLEGRARKLLRCTLFKEVSRAETSSAGLTQIAAQPAYGRAFRLGNRALADRIEGEVSDDQLHIPPSWGIYETWCFIEVQNIIDLVSGLQGQCTVPDATGAERAARYELNDGSTLEVLFQATFKALDVADRQKGWSLSRERRPDIVLVHRRAGRTRAMILDAKWRSGRDNVLDAMASAHIYHDALRIGQSMLAPVLLLLPGSSSVSALDDADFLRDHQIGAVTRFNVDDEGRMRLADIVTWWLSASSEAS